MKGSLLLSFFLMLSSDSQQLPCSEMNVSCVDRLVGQAAERRREIVVIEKAIELQRRKLWTTWITADAANPLSMGLRLIRNIAGGGDRGAIKLEIARLELRKAEMLTSLRESISRRLLELEQAEGELGAVSEKSRMLRNRLQILELVYVAGGESTKGMLELWLQERELQIEKKRIEARLTAGRYDLESLVFGHVASR